uniref:Uncharacterized protein n=1 Tax=Astyanax mexicanus TaxID=7994 RepID=A0A3B1JAC8_ASTMX
MQGNLSHICAKSCNICSFTSVYMLLSRSVVGLFSFSSMKMHVQSVCLTDGTKQKLQFLTVKRAKDQEILILSHKAALMLTRAILFSYLDAKLKCCFLLQEIANVQNHYEKLKQGLPVTSSISVTTVNLTSKLQECILEFQHWQEKRKAAKNKKNKGTTVKEEEGTQDTEFECSMRADLLASIKSKSYSRTTKASRSRRHRQVEMDTSGSGTDHAHEYLETRKNRPPSLKARTCKNIITIKKDENDDRTQHWLLSSREEDRKALKRPVQRNRFKL